MKTFDIGMYNDFVSIAYKLIYGKRDFIFTEIDLANEAIIAGATNTIDAKRIMNDFLQKELRLTKNSPSEITKSDRNLIYCKSCSEQKPRAAFRFYTDNRTGISFTYDVCRECINSKLAPYKRWAYKTKTSYKEHRLKAQKKYFQKIKTSIDERYALRFLKRKFSMSEITDEMIKGKVSQMVNNRKRKNAGIKLSEDKERIKKLTAKRVKKFWEKEKNLCSDKWIIKCLKRHNKNLIITKKIIDAHRESIFKSRNKKK